jgi:hypothetical protein
VTIRTVCARQTSIAALGFVNGAKKISQTY